MADSRTLKLSILADVDQLRKGLNTGAKDVSGFGDKISKFGKLAAGAFVAAGAAAAVYAGKLAIDGVKSAIEDEKAQATLAKTLQNVTKATDAQIAATEDYITKTALATGVGDDELRPSLDRLVRSFGSVEDAQKAQTLALDIAAGSGKSLQAVSEALSKAHDGQFTALKKLGVPLDESIIKNKDYEGAVKALSATFGGQAATAADTFDGKMQRLNVAFDEAKETVGGYILDALEPLSGQLLDNVMPALGGAAEEIGKNLQPAFEDLQKIVQEWLLPAIQGLWKYLTEYLFPAISSMLAPALDGLRAGLDTIRDAFQQNSDKLKPLIELVQTLVAWARDNLAPVIGGILGKAFEILGWAIGKLIEGIAWLVEKFGQLWEWGSKRIPAAFDTMRKRSEEILGFFRDKFGGIFNFITTPFRKAFEVVSKLWNMTIGKLSWTVPDWVPGIGGNQISAPKLPESLPMLATGGIVTRPTVAMIGERGAEAVIPLNQLGRYGGVTINISGALDPEAVARQIQTLIRRSELRAGAFA